VPCCRAKAGPKADPFAAPTLVDGEMREFGELRGIRFLWVASQNCCKYASGAVSETA
jgi:hypothetical protein